MNQNNKSYNEMELNNTTYHQNITYYRAPPQYYRDGRYVTMNPYDYVQYPYYNYQIPQHFTNQANIQYIGQQNYTHNDFGNYYNNNQYNPSQYSEMKLYNNNKSVYNNQKHEYNYNNRYNSKIKIKDEPENFDCHVCNLYFDKKQKLEKHLKNDHIPCIHEGCNFTAPLQILEVHALKHLKNDKGELIMDSPEEIRIWRERRLANHPSNPNKNAVQNDHKTNKSSSLEEFLRNSMNSFTSNQSSHITLNDQEPKASALVPILNKIIPTPSALYSFLEPEKADRKIQSLESKIGGPYSYSLSLKRKFNVCKSFLKKKTCKYGTNCTYSHDLAAFKRWKKVQFNLQVPKRPPLLYRLLKPEILIYEELLIKGIIYIVKSNFLQPKKIPLIEELEDNKLN